MRARILELRRRGSPASRAAGEGESSSAQAAVIDIGSNSVRLIIYRREGRAFWPIFNEKLLAGLGRGLSETGRLSPQGVEAALRTLRRFEMILRARGVREVLAFATAAVREAEDGLELVRIIREQCRIEVRVLSGAEEGRLSALGVLAGGVEDDCLVGDLGGSSLELCPIASGRPGEGVTLPLGPLAVLGKDGMDMAALRRAAMETLDSAPHVFDTGVRDFYAVGGSWRMLARVDMNLRDYPLHVLHHYEMTRAQAHRTAEFVAGQSAQSLATLPQMTSRRAPLLPYAAMLMDCILERGGFERVVISAYGVREGALFDRMPPELQEQDALLAGATAFARRLAPASTVGDALADWIEPVFAGNSTPRARALRHAAALLADMGSAMHPDHRGELSADQILYSPVAGMDHAERAFLAAALYHRYRGPADPPENFPAREITPSGTLEQARSLGLALRLGCMVSGRAPALLGLTRIAAEEGRLVLSVAREGEPLITDQTEKRLKQLASALGLKPEIVTEG